MRNYFKADLIYLKHNRVKVFWSDLSPQIRPFCGSRAYEQEESPSWGRRRCTRCKETLGFLEKEDSSRSKTCCDYKRVIQGLLNLIGQSACHKERD